MNAPTDIKPPMMTIEDSINSAHNGCDRAERLLGAIWSSLTGDEDPSSLGLPTLPLAPMAQALSQRSHVIADRLEFIIGRLASPRVVQMGSASALQDAAKGQRNAY